MKISIFASIWAQNLWDELILKNEIKILEKKYWKNTKFFVFTYDKKEIFFKKKNIFYLEYFPIWISKIKNIFRNISNFIIFLFTVIKSDLILVWWWGIIYDNELQETRTPLDSWLFRVKFFIFFMKKYAFFRVWINIKNDINLLKIKKIFRNASDIEVRDKYSFELLKKLWIKSKVVKDPVFYDKWIEVEEKSIIWKIKAKNFNVKDLKSFDFDWKKIGISFRSWYLADKSKFSKKIEEWKIREIINYIIENWWKVVLLPHSFHKTDVLANDYVFLNKFTWKNVKIKTSMEDVYKVYKNRKIDLCLSMRFHSIVLCHVYEIPFLWISYSTKTDEVLDFLKKK